MEPSVNLPRNLGCKAAYEGPMIFVGHFWHWGEFINLCNPITNTRNQIRIFDQNTNSFSMSPKPSNEDLKRCFFVEVGLVVVGLVDFKSFLPVSILG